MVLIENKEVKEALYELSIQNYNDKDELYWLPLYGLFDEDKDGC